MKKKISSLYKRLRQKINPSKRVLDRDVILAVVFKAKATKLAIGNKVIIDRGLANINKLKEKDWVELTYGDKNFVDHKLRQVYQYFVSYTEPLSGKQKVYALSFSDYEYIDQDEERSVVRVHITKRKYAKLIEEDVELRRHLYHFNTVANGKHSLNKLKADGYQFDSKRKLITIKKR